VKDHKTQTVLPLADTAAMLFWAGDVVRSVATVLRRKQ
jgi:hypothetical protein